MAKSFCSICGNDAGVFNFTTVNKEKVCSKCFQNAGNTNIRNLTIEQVKEKMLSRGHDSDKIKAENEQKALEKQNFNTTKKVSIYFEIDEQNKKWRILGSLGGSKNSVIYNFSDIVDYELLEDGSSITKGGVGRALVGEALFGGVGAIVGGITGRKNQSMCNLLQIKITLNNMTNPAVFIKFIGLPTKKDSLTYKSNFKVAQECLSILQLICKSIEDEKGISYPKEVSTISSADEILKFKQLLDSGIVTQEEFDVKKKQLLSI